MDIILPLDKMTAEEKLHALDAIWTDLLKHPDQIPLQQWHKDLLDERQQMVAEGRAKYVAWETAKKEIDDDISRGRTE